MAIWVLNDENKVNSFGFRVKNAGIDLERFRKNPIMLAMHNDWNLLSIIGRWINIRIEGSQLLADDEFDMEDPDSKRIAEKAKRGFIKGCSIGLPISTLVDNMTKNGDVFELAKTELLEASLVTIPSNANAVRLYADSGELIKEDQVKLNLSAIMKIENSLPENKSTKSKMEKFILSAKALGILVLAGLMLQDDPVAVNQAIETLGANLKKAQDDLDEASRNIQTMKDAQLAQLKANANTLVDDAIKAGKLTADMKDKMVTMAINDFELASGIISGMPGKTGLGAHVKNSGAAGSDEAKTIDEFEKLPLAKQLAFKEDNPEGYKALFARK